MSTDRNPEKASATLWKALDFSMQAVMSSDPLLAAFYVGGLGRLLNLDQLWCLICIVDS